jgi:starch synthase
MDSHVVMVAGEAVPFAKVGGLADVIGALPVHLHDLGTTVSIIIPRYRTIDLKQFGFEPYPISDLPTIPLGFNHYPFDVHRGRLPSSDVSVYLIGNDQFFDRDGIYLDAATGKDYPDQADRWIFFQRAALELLAAIAPDVDVIHCHDHQTGLIPAYVRRLFRPRGIFTRTGTIFTIHNLGYQGLFPAEVMMRTGFNLAEFYPASPFEFFGMLNFMKAGISYADIVTTVSETYAREICETGEYGYGLEGVLRDRGDELVGILNGIDYDAWNPETDPSIPAHFSAKALAKRKENRKALLKEYGLKNQPDWPVLAMVSRIDVQKGFDLVVKILDDLLSQDLYFILLGSGNKETEAELRAIAERHSDRAGLRFTYDGDLSHLIEAGADIFLMPSKYEPCGLNQMYSMRYGTVPVVRATGGLADTVLEFDPQTGKGTGFTFDEYDADRFRSAIDRALQVWNDSKAWRRVKVNGMTADFSWMRSARKYVETYERVVRRYRA